MVKQKTDPTDAAALIVEALRTLADHNPAAAASIIESLGSLASHESAPELWDSEREVESQQEGCSEQGSEDDEEKEYEVDKEWSPGGAMEDLSVLIAPDLPCNWPSSFLPSLIIMRYIRRGPEPYVSEAIVIDEHTGTHWDAPPHFIPPPSTGLPAAADIGFVPSDQMPAWQFVGEACVVDVRDLMDNAGPGLTPDITRQIVQQWEQANRPLGPGDAVMFRADYSDKYYRQLPEGRRLVDDVFMGLAQPWPGVDPDCMDYLAGLKVQSVGTDSPNIGPASAVAIETHIAGLKNGLIYTENLTNLGCLPTTGAACAILGPKHASGSGGEARVVALVEPEIATQVIRSAKLQQVVDLSVLLREDLPVSWPGLGVPTYRMPYLGRTLHSWEQPGGPALIRTHILDSHTGTHLVPPTYAVPEPGFDRKGYNAQTRQALHHFENRFGPIGTSTTTADKVPVAQLSGPARVIDVTHLVGTVAPKPESPPIRVSDIKRHERMFGPIKSGEIVIFHSAHTDRFFQPFPYGNRCVADPINGKTEGWPAPTAETIFYLAEQGVSCVGTDAPRMGGTDPIRALSTYWAGGSRDMCFVEYLINVGALPSVGAFFLFAPVKVRGSHGGYGRALGII